MDKQMTSTAHGAEDAQDTWLAQLSAMEKLIVPGAVFDYTAVYQDGQPHRTLTVLEVRSNRRVSFEVEGERYMRYRRALAEGLVTQLAVRRPAGEPQDVRPPAWWHGENAVTDKQLAAIRARCEAATPGPWFGIWKDGEDEPDVCKAVDLEHAEDGLEHIATIHTIGRARWDTDFIAHAREDVLALLAEVESLRGLLSSGAVAS